MSRAGFWTTLEAKWDAQYRSTIVVIGDLSLDVPSHKLCIDDRAYGTGARYSSFAPPNSIYTRIEAGRHIIVLMERDAGKAGRLVSNTLQLEIGRDQKVVIGAMLREGQIRLGIEEILDHVPETVKNEPEN